MILCNSIDFEGLKWIVMVHESQLPEIKKSRVVKFINFENRPKWNLVDFCNESSAH